MDTTSASAVARELGTSIPRVVRAAHRLGLGRRRENGRIAFTRTETNRLRRELGVTPPVEGLSQTQVKVLAALRLAPLGLSSIRSVASRAAVSPTAASRALRELEREDLAWREPTTIAAGSARRVEVWHANLRAERWRDLAPVLARVELPRGRPRPDQDRRVPRRLRHLFWNTASEQLDVARSGPYIARRLLRTMDPEGLAWGAETLRRGDWQKGAGARGLSESTRALAGNLAKAGRG